MSGTTGRPTLHARLVTLTGSGGNKADAVRDSQDILEARFAARGMAVRPIDLGTWAVGRVPDILRAIRRERPDVILMQYPTDGFGASLGPPLLSAIQRIAPLVVMLHEFVAAHPLRKLAVGALTARAALVATTADREARTLGTWYPWLRGRLRSVPISSNIPGRAWAPTQPPKVVYFGQLRPEKGLEAFLACQAILSATMPDVSFQIAGAAVPKFADYAASIIEKAGAQGVTLLQGLESDDVSDWLSTATVALLPYPDGASYRRGSMFAATACGVPLATTTGADTPADLRTMIDPAVTAAELSSLVLRYLTDEAARRQAHERSVRIDDMFGWDQTVDHYVQVFSEAIRQRQPNRDLQRPAQASAA